MAKPTEIESKIVPPSDDDLNPHNFSFDETTLADAILTDSGVWSASKSLILGGKQKGKVAPFFGWYEGTKLIQTNHDRENAVEAYVKACGIEGKSPDPAMMEKVKEEAPPGLYFVFNLIEPTVVVKGGQPKVQKSGKIVTHANVMLASELAKYTTHNPDGSQRLKNIFKLRVGSTGQDTTSKGLHLSQFAVKCEGFMPLDAYNEEQSMKAFGGMEAAAAMGLISGKNGEAKALPAAAASTSA